MIIATQRPSVDVITGVIKSNIPSRIAFAVSSSVDSRTILDETGAEGLLGLGDMLVHISGKLTTLRVQGAYVSDEEIINVVNYIKSQGEPQYDEKFINLDTPKVAQQMSIIEDLEEDDEDDLYYEIRQYVSKLKTVSISLLQRKFSIGFNRAARFIDRLEGEGLISAQQNSRPREVYTENFKEIE